MKYCFALLLLVCTSAFGVGPGDIRALLDQGHFAEAHQLARSHPENMGEPEFDFYLGIAALEAGVAGEAVLALERYATVFPDNRNARFQLARAYFALGEDQHAREEFDRLLNDAGADDQEAIRRFLDAIRARESRYKPVAGLWLDIGLGHDSNVTSGVKPNQLVDIPGVSSAFADPNGLSLRRADWFTSFSLGIQGTFPLEPGVSLFANAGLDSKSYGQPNMNQFDQLTLATSGGISWLFDKNLLRLSIDLQKVRIFQQDYLFKYGLSTEWMHIAGPEDRFSLIASGGEMRYSDTLVHATIDKSDERANSAASQRSAHYLSLTTAWTHSFGMDWQPVLNLSAGFQREENTQDRPDYSRNLYSLRAQWSMTPAPDWAMALGASHTYASHLGAFGGIATVNRQDRYFSADALLSYRIDRYWSVLADALVAYQNSNVGLFDYSRNMVSTKLRYEIR